MKVQIELIESAIPKGMSKDGFLSITSKMRASEVLQKGYGKLVELVE